MLHLFFLYWTKIFIEKTKKAKNRAEALDSWHSIICSTVINQGIVETTAFDFPGKFFLLLFFFLERETFQQTALAQILKYSSAEV